MKYLLLFSSFIFILFCACESQTPGSSSAKMNAAIQDTSGGMRIDQSAFQRILDSAQLTGTIVFYDPQKQTYYSNDFDRAEHGFLPASTFKIPNSFIALETGVVNDQTIIKWNGQKQMLKQWEKDMNLREAYRVSCVPCYQWVAREIGVKQMQEKLAAFEYPGMDVSAETLDNFWLAGRSRISPMQEIAFLQKIYLQKLPVQQSTYNLMKQIMLQDSTDQYVLRGKTGWVVRDGFNIGWYVGYFEVGKHVYYFATNVEPMDEFDMKNFPRIRPAVTLQAYANLRNRQLIVGRD